MQNTSAAFTVTLLRSISHKRSKASARRQLPCYGSATARAQPQSVYFEAQLGRFDETDPMRDCVISDCCRIGELLLAVSVRFKQSALQCEASMPQDCSTDLVTALLSTVSASFHIL